MSMQLDLSVKTDDTSMETTKPLDLSRCLSEHSPLPLIAVEGLNHLARYANPAFCRLAGTNAEDLIGKPFSRAMPEGEENGCLALLDDVYRTGETASLADQPHCNSTLQPGYWSYVAWAIRDAAERTTGVMLQVTDTTQRVLASQQLGRFNQTLMLSGLHQHELTEVAEAGILDLQRSVRETNHRAKNNLQVISALLDMQIVENREAVSVSALTQTRLHIQTFASFHNLLTSISKEDPKAGVVSTTAILEELLPMWQGIVGTQGLQWSAEEIELPVKRGISLALLINELVTNAVKHGGHKVELRLTARENTVTLTVSDDGPGFPPTFDPFTAAHFGLEYVETVVRLELRGSVTYANCPDGGACVMVTFPLAASAATSPNLASIPFASVFAPALLQETMRSFTAFANTIQDYAIILLDERADILKWNLGAEHLFGYSVQEMLGKPLAALFAPEDVSAGHVAREIQQARQEGRASDDRWMLRKDGSRFFASGLLTTLTDTSVRGFIKILRDKTANKQAEEERLRQQAEIAVLQERNRLAQELHDTLAQGFVGIAMQLEAAKGLLTSELDQAEHHLSRAATLARESMAEARRSVQALRPTLLQDKDLPSALAQMIAHATSGTSVTGEFVAQGNAQLLLPAVEDDLLRIGQEAVTNALRHGQATRVRVELTFTPELVRLCIQDNGKGFDALTSPPSGHYGLVGMRERAERLGGQLVIRSEAGRGTEISVAVLNHSATQAEQGKSR